MPVHYGTLWPTGLRHVSPAQFRRKCLEPGERFADAMQDADATAHVLSPGTSIEIATAR